MRRGAAYVFCRLQLLRIFGTSAFTRRVCSLKLSASVRTDLGGPTLRVCEAVLSCPGACRLRAEPALGLRRGRHDIAPQLVVQLAQLIVSMDDERVGCLKLCSHAGDGA